MALGLLYREVGVALLPGVAVVGLMLAANRMIARRTYARQAVLLAARDGRVRLMRELLASIKALKLHAWEVPDNGRTSHQPCVLHICSRQPRVLIIVSQAAFAERVGAARQVELAASAAIVRLRAVLAAVFSSTPTLVAVTMLGMRVALGHGLSLQSALTVPRL